MLSEEFSLGVRETFSAGETTNLFFRPMSKIPLWRPSFFRQIYLYTFLPTAGIDIRFFWLFFLLPSYIEFDATNDKMGGEDKYTDWKFRNIWKMDWKKIQYSADF